MATYGVPTKALHEHIAPAGAAGALSQSAWNASGGVVAEQELRNRLLRGLRIVAGTVRLKPRQCLELVSEVCCPGHLVVLESAWSSAGQAKGFDHGDQLFELLWHLATAYRAQKLTGAADRIAEPIFGGNSDAPRESQTIESNTQARRAPTFSDQGKTVEMGQHLKIGSNDSDNRTLRIHVCWDEELNQVVIGHCGKHLHDPKH